MKAAVLYGNEDLRYDDYPTPEVTPGTVKVKVRATGICGSDVPRVLHHGAHFYLVNSGSIACSIFSIPIPWSVTSTQKVSSSMRHSTTIFSIAPS